MTIRRREVLKGLSMVAGGALCGTGVPNAVGEDVRWRPGTPLVSPVRALMERDGREVQAVQIAVLHAGLPLPVVTRFDGVEVDRRQLLPGANEFLLGAAPVTSARDLRVEVMVGTEVTTRVVRLEPVRRLTIYVLPHSHHDLGYTDLQADVEAKQMDNISRGMELARSTAGYPEGSRFVWNLEVLWGADLFLRRRPAAEQAAFVEAVKAGHLALNGMYANELTGLCRPEELLRLFRFGVELGERCGVLVRSAMASDVPGFTWGTVTAMAQAGHPVFFDRAELL